MVNLHPLPLPALHLPVRLALGMVNPHLLLPPALHLLLNLAPGVTVVLRHLLPQTRRPMVTEAGAITVLHLRLLSLLQALLLLARPAHGVTTLRLLSQL